MKVTAIVPSYKPDEKLAGVLRDLAAAGFERIIVVDDGSGPEYEAYFRQAEGYPQCVLLRHEVNRVRAGRSRPPLHGSWNTPGRISAW